jgi:hypothetical protein
MYGLLRPREYRYARHNVNPQLASMDQDKVARLYAELRRESAVSGGVPIAVRHLESIMRMSEAHARMVKYFFYIYIFFGTGWLKNLKLHLITAAFDDHTCILPASTRPRSRR